MHTSENYAQFYLEYYFYFPELYTQPNFLHTSPKMKLNS